MLVPFVSQLTTYRTHSARPGQKARLELEELEDRSAPGNLGGLIGFDGLSLLANTSALTGGMATDPSLVPAQTSSQPDTSSTSSLDAATTTQTPPGAGLQVNPPAPQTNGQPASPP